jgi:hypothetical protein
MFSKKRVFSNNKIVNYIDYNNLKNGCETLKTIKCSNNTAILKQFKNHQSWQTLSNAYFPYIDNHVIEVSPVTNLYESSESYIEDPININNCQIEKNILYPNGKIVARKQVTKQFPSNIDLSKWCNKHYECEPCNKTNKPDECEPCNKTNKPNKCKCCKKTYKQYDCVLCKNARNLFI